MTLAGDPIAHILSARRRTPGDRALLVAVSGIDGAGKGYVTNRVADGLSDAGCHTAVIHADGWLNLPHVRFAARDPGPHFYEHALRFNEMFERLIVPLRDRRSHDLEFDYAEETASTYRREHVRYRNVDIILLEAVFLLKRGLRRYYDMSFWLDCTFQTALGRALNRRQEGLSEQATIHAYQTIYFPAQRVHFRLDRPLLGADFVLPNDPRLNVAAA